MTKTKDDYPIMLEPAHIQEILGLGRKNTYQFLNEVEAKVYLKKEPEFHLKRIGKLMKIPKDSFFDWLEGNTTK
ncbi:DNA-binding protein [Paenibacillus sp. HJL G12]|uniref:DNA-binding protein n=1 Tax=Paenibacillus dendrobii TaxID=2691084 RepID=A0A7X3IJR4_9BACL|nr:DNA-binding protein [Paenibacillus dendrobii]MWV44788.1 DNA-binding protein [Paenibacillus dendrobii]